MDIKMYLQVIRRWIWLIALLTIVGAGTSYYLVSKQPKSYTAQVKLLVGPTINDTTTMAASQQKGAPQVIQTYANLVTTRGILQQVIDELNLTISVNKLAGQITVTPNPDSQILTVAVQSSDQKEAIAEANALGQALVRLYSNPGVSDSPDVGPATSAQVAQLQTQIAQTQARINQLNDDFKTQAQAGSSPAIISEENKIQDLENKLNGPINPDLAKQIQDHQTRIQQLEASYNSTLALDARRLILDELSREDSLMNDLRNQINDQKLLLTDQLGQERNQLSSMQSNILQKQNQILNQLSIEGASLASAQRTLDTLLPGLSSITRQITIIDPAANAAPNSNNTALIVLFSAIAGMVLGLTLAFSIDYLDDRIQTPEQLSTSTGLHVWGTVKKHQVLLPVVESRMGLPSPADQKITEVFRQWCLKLTPNGASNVCSLLVSNFEQGDASAQVASNLAVTLSRTGKRVILIDGNIHKPLIGSMFQLNGDKGLADWLANGTDKPEMRVIDWAPGLSVLPVGPLAPDQAEELVWPRMDDLLKCLTTQADIVIVAGPPLDTSADSFFLASLVSGVLPIAQINKTKRKQASDTIESLNSLGVLVLGSILAADGKLRFKALPMPEHRAGIA